MDVLRTRRNMPTVQQGVRRTRHHPHRAASRRRLSEELQTLIAIVIGVVLGAGIVLILVTVWWEAMRR